MPFDPIAFIHAHCSPRPVTSVQMIYDQTESQSGRSLPEVYVPFDGRRLDHFVDRGQILEIALSVGNGHILDFGPGDGWPALPLASLVRQVTGVDGSARRVRVCSENARRMGLDNACFVHVAPGALLPFPDGSFDGITAASSIEQTPDPKATLRELHRVLKAGGRLHMSYESLNYYRGGQEHGLTLWQMEAQCTSLLLYDRHADQEHVVQYRLALTLSEDQVRALFRQYDCPVTFAGLSEPLLTELIQHVADAQVCTTTHPSYGTLVRWLGELGFGSIRPIADTRCFMSSLFEALPADQRPVTKEAANAYLLPIMQAFLHMPCSAAAGPGRWDPAILAVKEGAES